jgi:hypothetical protein
MVVWKIRGKWSDRMRSHAETFIVSSIEEEGGDGGGSGHFMFKVRSGCNILTFCAEMFLA